MFREPLANLREGSGDLSRKFPRQQEPSHKAVGSKHQCQDDLAALHAFKDIHFRHRHPRIFFHEVQIISVGALDPAFALHLVFNRLALAGLEHAGAWQIAALRMKQPAIDIAVDGLHIDWEKAGVSDRHGMYGLAL